MPKYNVWLPMKTRLRMRTKLHCDESVHPTNNPPSSADRRSVVDVPSLEDPYLLVEAVIACG